MTTTPLDWDTIDHDDNLGSLFFGGVLVANIGADDDLWIEPTGDAWKLSHNTREISRHEDTEAAKRAAARYFRTL